MNLLPEWKSYQINCRLRGSLTNHQRLTPSQKTTRILSKQDHIQFTKALSRVSQIWTFTHLMTLLSCQEEEILRLYYLTEKKGKSLRRLMFSIKRRSHLSLLPNSYQVRMSNFTASLVHQMDMLVCGYWITKMINTLKGTLLRVTQMPLQESVSNH